MRPSLSRTLQPLAPLALFALALLVRGLPRKRVLVGDDVIPFGNDAYYHLRRIAYSVVHFPEVLDFDPYINFPHGAKPIWPPLFDWMVALASLPFYRPDEVQSVELLAVWVPPVLGAATVVSLFALAKRHLGVATAFVAASILSVLPAHFHYSQIGFVDHHAAVALTATWLLGASMTLLDRDGRASGGATRSALAAGACLAIALLVWPGSLLHAGVVELGLLIHLLCRPTSGAARSSAGRFALVQVVACLLLLPLCWGNEWVVWGRWSPVVLSRFQPWLFGSLALWGAACALLWRGDAWGVSRARRVISGLAVGLVILALGGLLLPELQRGAVDAWRWLARIEQFQASVGESLPLFVDAGHFDIEAGVERLSGFVLVFPGAVLLAGFWAWRRSNRPALLLWLGWSLTLFVVTLVQRRFFNSFSVGLALTMGWAVCEAWRRLGERAPGGAVGRGAARLALVGVAVAILAPSLGTYGYHLRNELAGDEGLRRVRPWVLPRLGLVAAARWLQRSTPATAGWLDRDAQPEYGVLGPWYLGHLLEYVARRPTVVDNFGDDIGERNLGLVRRYYSSREAESAKILEELRVRYVIAPQRHDFLDAVPDDDAVFMALAYFDGSEREFPQIGDPPALSRHRLVYEADPVVDRGSESVPLLKIYEFVPGVRIGGRAAPGRRIRASLALLTNRGREFVYRTTTSSSAEGRYQLRVPYGSAHSARYQVKPLGPYTLSCDGDTARLTVPEWAVKRGAAMKGPDLCR
jgi:dolichyl-diphosphooligosaccharide--protein glycosyltransferase